MSLGLLRLPALLPLLPERIPRSRWRMMPPRRAGCPTAGRPALHSRWRMNMKASASRRYRLLPHRPLRSRPHFHRPLLSRRLHSKPRHLPHLSPWLHPSRSHRHGWQPHPLSTPSPRHSRCGSHNRQPPLPCSRSNPSSSRRHFRTAPSHRPSPLRHSRSTLRRRNSSPHPPQPPTPRHLHRRSSPSRNSLRHLHRAKRSMSMNPHPSASWSCAPSSAWTGK